MAVEADNVEFTDCAFLGSQDTLYTGAVDIYFKNCLIEGNTDYIFGDGDVVFDGCELSWYGYSTGGLSGYITAQRPTTQNGYIFRNCTITANPELPVKPGYFGRPWGAGAKVSFINTKIEGDLIVDEGWTEMSGNKPQGAAYVEYNSVKTDGTKVDTSKRVAGTGVDVDINAVNDYVKSFAAGIGSSSYVEEDAEVKFATIPYVVDNGDINAPYPGHTLTVGYSLGAANDAMMLQLSAGILLTETMKP